MHPTELAKLCKALGDPTRARIFQFLLDCSSPVALDDNATEVRRVEGPTVGEVCCHITGLDKVTSTTSFHLKELREAGLISMEKRGKFMVCSIDQTTLQSLTSYFVEVSSRETCC